jgi:hypothetical protein
MPLLSILTGVSGKQLARLRSRAMIEAPMASVKSSYMCNWFELFAECQLKTGRM